MGVFVYMDMCCDAIMLQQRGKDYLIENVSKISRDIHGMTPVSVIAQPFPRQVYHGKLEADISNFESVVDQPDLPIKYVL